MSLCRDGGFQNGFRVPCYYTWHLNGPHRNSDKFDAALITPVFQNVCRNCFPASRAERVREENLSFFRSQILIERRIFSPMRYTMCITERKSRKRKASSFSISCIWRRRRLSPLEFSPRSARPRSAWNRPAPRSRRENACPSITHLNITRGNLSHLTPLESVTPSYNSLLVRTVVIVAAAAAAVVTFICAPYDNRACRINLVPRYYDYCRVSVVNTSPFTSLNMLS